MPRKEYFCGQSWAGSPSEYRSIAQHPLHVAEAQMGLCFEEAVLRKMEEVLHSLQ